MKYTYVCFRISSAWVCVCVRTRSVAQSCPTLCNPMDFEAHEAPQASLSMEFFGKNTGVGCRFLL